MEIQSAPEKEAVTDLSYAWLKASGRQAVQIYLKNFWKNFNVETYFTIWEISTKLPH